VKVLATGELTKKLSFEGCAMSATAIAKIEKAGGTVAK
jgi:ribosomal protein L15